MNKFFKQVSSLGIITVFFAVLAITPLNLSVVNTAQAEALNQYTLLEPLPCIPNSDQDCSKGDVIKTVNIDQYVNYVFNLSMALAVLLSVIMIFWGGFEYVTSEIPGMKSDGKTKIQNAILGLILILVSYLILNTIDPRLTKIQLGLPKIIGLQTYSSYDLEDLAERTALQNIAKYAEETRHDAEAKIKLSNEELVKADALDRQARNAVDPQERARLTIEAEQARAKAVELKVASTQKVIEGSSKIHIDNIDRIMSGTGRIPDEDIKQIKYEKDSLIRVYDNEISLLESYGKADVASKLKSEKAVQIAQLNDSIFTQQVIRGSKITNYAIYSQDPTGTGQYGGLIPFVYVYTAKQKTDIIADRFEKYTGGLDSLTSEQKKVVLDNRKVLAAKIRESVK